MNAGRGHLAGIPSGERHLIAEGPTGTGKSLAYLVPAIFHATQDPPLRIRVVTATIALQEQLVTKDLPFASSWGSHR